MLKKASSAETTSIIATTRPRPGETSLLTVSRFGNVWRAIVTSSLTKYFGSSSGGWPGGDGTCRYLRYGQRTFVQSA